MTTLSGSTYSPAAFAGTLPPEVLTARQRACPNYTPFTIGGTYGGTIIPSKEKIQFVTLDVPHGKRGSAAVRGWAKFLGARWEPNSKEWRVAGENLLDTFTSGQTTLDGLNAMRLITGWKPYTPAYVARNLGVRTVWANPPFSKRALVKAFLGARWDPVERAWSIPVSENDQAFSQQLSVLERMGWVDTVKSEAPQIGTAPMTPAAIVPVDANQAAAMVFVPAASNSPRPRRSSRRQFTPLVTPTFSPAIDWFDPHIKASTPGVGGSGCGSERLWLGGLLDLYHTCSVTDDAVQHVFLRPPASTPREHSDYAAAFEFFANSSVSTQAADIVRVGFYTPEDSAPLTSVGTFPLRASCRIGWNWAYLPRSVARSVWDNMTRHYGWEKDQAISRTLHVGEAMGWVVLGDKIWPSTEIPKCITIREALIIRSGRSGSPNPEEFAFPMNRNSPVWEILVRRFGGSQP